MTTRFRPTRVQLHRGALADQLLRPRVQLADADDAKRQAAIADLNAWASEAASRASALLRQRLVGAMVKHDDCVRAGKRSRRDPVDQRLTALAASEVGEGAAVSVPEGYEVWQTRTARGEALAAGDTEGSNDAREE